MKKLFGSLLLGCGIIVAGLSGLCTLIFAGSALFGASSGQEMMSIIPIALIFGAIPIALGIGMYFGGRALLNAANKDEPPVSPKDAAPARPPEEPPAPPA